MRVALHLGVVFVASSAAASHALETGHEARLRKVEALMYHSSGSNVALRSLLSRLVAQPTKDLQVIFANLKEKLAKDVEDRIQKDHRDTQDVITNRVTALSNMTAQVVSSKKKGDELNQKWSQCIGAEIDILGEYKREKGKLPALSDGMDEACQAHEDSAVVTAVANLPTFECRHSKEAECQERLGKYEEFVNTAEGNVKGTIKTKVQTYRELESACQDKTSAHTKQTALVKTMLNTFVKKRHECLGAKAMRQTEMCRFGMLLQDKCVLLSEYRLLIADVDTVGGGEHSHPDRVEEWKVTQIAKCLVGKLAHSSDIDEEALADCEAATNFDRDVGELLRKSDEVNQLTTADKFTCKESAVEWTGGSWDITRVSPPDTNTYELVPSFAPVLSLDDHSIPFAFCGGAKPPADAPPPPVADEGPLPADAPPPAADEPPPPAADVPDAPPPPAADEPPPPAADVPPTDVQPHLVIIGTPCVNHPGTNNHLGASVEGSLEACLSSCTGNCNYAAYCPQGRKGCDHIHINRCSRYSQCDPVGEKTYPGYDTYAVSAAAGARPRSG